MSIPMQCLQQEYIKQVIYWYLDGRTLDFIVGITGGDLQDIENIIDEFVI